MVDETGNTEDFDFDFIDSTIKSSTDEMHSALQACFDEIKGIQRESELIEAAQEVSASLSGSASSIVSIQQQFQEFLNRTDFVQKFARSKQTELEEVNQKLIASEKDQENEQNKVGYLEEEIRTNKAQLENYEQNTAHLEQELDELRQTIVQKDEIINEHKEAQVSLEQEMDAAKEAKSGQDSSHEVAKKKLDDLLEESKEALKVVERENSELKQRCTQQETKISDQEDFQKELERKFEQWEKVFKAELDKHKEKSEFYKNQMEGDQQALNDKIESQEEEIAELKLQLTSKELELQNQNNLNYDMMETEDENDQTIDEGEEAKYGLSGDFHGKQSDSRVEGDEDHSGIPLIDGDPDSQELSQLGGGMIGNAEAEYAEIDGGAQNDIFAQDNLDENDKLELINTNMGMENQSMNSASTITQKWEQDARKDPEEEYFRLSCLALKIIYNEQDTDFVFTVAPGKLYAKCKKQKIPFHLWYTWIEKELQKVNDLQKRAVEASARPKSLMERLQASIFSARGGR